MYLYYFLSAFGPKMQPFLWWKKWDLSSNYFSDYYLRVVKLSNDQILFPPGGRSEAFHQFSVEFIFQSISVVFCLQVIKFARNQNSIKETNLQVLILLRYLTRLQMIQFVCVFIHALLPLYFDCGYPKIMPKVIFAFCFKSPLWSQLTLFRSWLPTPPSSLFFSPISISLPT